MTPKRNLLEEAIADAKIIKAAAIENATQALNETFTPFLKEKLSAKLAEMESEDELDENEEMGTEDSDIDELLAGLEEDDDLQLEAKKDEPKEPKEPKDGEEENEEDEEIDLENMTETDLKAFVEDVIQDMVSSGDLKAGEGENETLEEEPEIEEVEEYGDEHHLSTKDALGLDDEDDIDIDELLNELKNSKEVKKPIQEDSSLKNQYKEALKTINELKETLNEVNLFNAKLLYSNKIFKSKNLNENQKIKVLRAFDKTKTKKEVELVYETLNEGLSKSKKPIIENKKIMGSAIKLVENMNSNSTKTPIIETNKAFTRMMEIAGLSPEK